MICSSNGMSFWTICSNKCVSYEQITVFKQINYLKSSFKRFGWTSFKSDKNSFRTNCVNNLCKQTSRVAQKINLKQIVQTICLNKLENSTKNSIWTNCSNNRFQQLPRFEQIINFKQIVSTICLNKLENSTKNRFEQIV